jgi:hypothetical protein
LSKTPCIAAGQKDGGLILAQRRELRRTDGNFRPYAAHIGIDGHGDGGIMGIAVIAFYRILRGDFGYAGNSGKFLLQAFGQFLEAEARHDEDAVDPCQPGLAVQAGLEARHHAEKRESHDGRHHGEQQSQLLAHQRRPE